MGITQMVVGLSTGEQQREPGCGVKVKYSPLYFQPFYLVPQRGFLFLIPFRLFLLV